MLRRWVCACLAALGTAQVALAQSPPDCEQAGRVAEQRFGVPPGLLLAIGRVESGRWDPLLGRVVPWPWSIDVDGKGLLFDNITQAASALQALQSEKSHSIDVGCYQISLLYHPAAFSDSKQAFDPQANALYAAQLLESLHARFGNWQDAVAAYHSATAEFGLPYRQRVFAAWSGTAPVSADPGTQFSSIPGVHVWVPATDGSASAVIAIRASSPASLPRVITPGG